MDLGSRETVLGIVTTKNRNIYIKQVARVEKKLKNKEQLFRL